MTLVNNSHHPNRRDFIKLANPAHVGRGVLPRIRTLRTVAPYHSDKKQFSL